MPISRKKMRHELSSEVKDAITACLTIDEAKRPTMKDIANLPYFRRILGVEKPKLPPQLNPSPGSALDLRVNRSPSNYVQGNNMLQSEQGEVRRKVSVDRHDQVPRALQKQQSEQAKKGGTTFLANAHQFPKNQRAIDTSKDSSLQRDRRAVSS